jgi:prepilin-type N-terminal cleavage/methylation domain-containing protein
MKVANPTSLRSNAGRAGFTLVELLVVMAIIATLAALTVSATMRVITVQDEATTKTLIQKVHSTLQKHWEAVIDKASKEPFPKALKDPRTGMPMYADFANEVLFPLATANLSQPPTVTDVQRARVIYIKMRLKQEFPMSYAEAVAPSPLPALPSYVASLPIGAKGINAWTECSGCLLLALSQARSGVVFNADDLGPNALIDLDNIGLKQIVDSWGKPIIFCRWPTGNTDVNNMNPGQTLQQQMFRDPQDPAGLLLDATWWAARHGAFQNSLHSLTNGANKYEYYMIPVVASAGAAKRAGSVTDPYGFGLDPVTMTPDGSGFDLDNIYSYNLR